MPKKEFTKSQKKTIDKIYRTLSQAGYDDFAIAGILGNALTESGFDPDSISKNKSYHGLWQNGSNIRKAIEQQYGDHSLDSQLKYLLDWGNKAKWVVNNAYTTTNAGRYKKAGYGSASDAGDAFMRLYERPVIMENGKVVGYQAHNERLANSDLMYNYINSTYGKPESVVTMTDTGKRMVFPKGHWDIPEQPVVEQQPIQTPLTPMQPKITTVAERAQNQDQIWQDFNQGAVAVGHKSILPKLSDMLDEGKTAYMRDALGLPDLWEGQEYSYTPMAIQPIQRFEDGKLPDSKYATIMERVARENNPKWNKDRRKEGVRELSEDEELLRILNDNTYNYRSYYGKYPNSTANADTHWTDEFKTVYHPSFSVQSVYSGRKSQYNPEGVLGGQWNGEQYIPAWGQLLPKGYKNSKLPGFSNGFLNIATPVSPYIAEQNSEAVHDIMSYLPWTGTILDTRDALNGDTRAVAPAIIGAAADTFGYKNIVNAYRAQKAFANAVKQRVSTADAYKLMKKANEKVKHALAGAATYLTDWYGNTVQMLDKKK